MLQPGLARLHAPNTANFALRLRRLARGVLPFEVRLMVAKVRRAARDRRAGHRFTARPDASVAFQHRLGAYSRPFIDYPGQEAAALAKRHNQAVLAKALDGVVIQPGEIFSLWRLAGRPTKAAGYEEAAAIRGNVLTTETGGATCLLSTTLYNTALLGGLEVVERHCHSADTYGEARYFELGRDAAIEYGWADLRFRNSLPVPVQLRIFVSDSAVQTELRTEAPVSVCSRIEVQGVLSGSATLAARTHRAVTVDGVQRPPEDLGESRYIRWPVAEEA